MQVEEIQIEKMCKSKRYTSQKEVEKNMQVEKICKLERCTS